MSGLSAAYISGSAFCEASSCTLASMFWLGVCWRLMGWAAASGAQAPLASVSSSCGVWVSSVVSSIEKLDWSVPVTPLACATRTAAVGDALLVLVKPVASSAKALRLAVVASVARRARLFFSRCTSPSSHGAGAQLKVSPRLTWAFRNLRSLLAVPLLGRSASCQRECIDIHSRIFVQTG
jgi:hypothetical protein